MVMKNKILQVTNKILVIVLLMTGLVFSQTVNKPHERKCNPVIPESVKNKKVDVNGHNCGEYDLGDFVWHDSNVNGLQDPGEEGIEGVLIILCHNNVPVDSMYTDANGHYKFEDLPEGVYGVRIAESNFQPGGVFAPSSNDVWYVTYVDVGNDDSIDNDGDPSDPHECLYLNHDDMDVDFGLFHTAVTLEKTGPQDVNAGDAITYHFRVENTGDLVLHGGCHVYDPLINPNGNHEIWNAVVNPGEVVEFDRQYTTTQSDCGQLTNTAQVVGHPKMPDGSYKPNVEMSDSWTTNVNCHFKLGDKIWHDSNVNGLQDAGENGIQNVVVQLYDDSGSLLSSTTTDANGNYLFEDLLPGTYVVKVADVNFQNGGVFASSSNDVWYATYQDAGNDDSDSDGDLNSHEATVTLSNADDLTIDFGFFHTAVTLQKTGPQDVNAGGVITYHFRVENTGDLVLHGGCHVYDPLINPNGNHEIWNAVVNPGQVVEFDRQYTTTQSDCGQLTNTAQVVGHPKMPDGSYKPNVEMSDSWTTNVINCNNSSVGDKVWYDDNENGIQDAGENGVENVLVRLFDCSDNLIATTNTNINGEYLFDNLAAGTYKIEFANIPSGYVFTQQDQGGDDTKDSDVDVNTGKTDCFTLGNSENKTDIDAGIVANPIADLSLEKTVDNPNPENGDEIEFTITVTNDGPNDATGVQVTDLLPAGFDFISSTPTQGTYDDQTGIWNIGSFTANATATLTIRTRVNIDTCNTSSFDLGPASGFNVFVFEDMTQPSSDTQGKVAVGGNASFSNYSIGDLTPGQDVLIVGGNLQFTSGAIYGNVIYGGTTNLPVSTVSIDGTLSLGTPIDFAAAESYLTNLSAQLSGYTVNGTTTFQWGGLTLTGNDPLINVFSVSGSDLSQANNVQINVPNGAVVLVNIDGQNVSWTGGLTVTGTAVNNVLYNFYQAQNLTIQGIDIRGSILAPYADVNFVSGVQNGQMIAKSIGGSGQFNTGQFNNELFVGNIPCQADLVNVAEITASNAQDPDSTPGNGDPNEDDYSSVAIHIGSQNNGGGGNGGGNNGNGNWELVQSLDSGELIWTMAYENDNKTYHKLLGTWGGKIYRVENGENVLLNPDMNVGFIWSIAVDPVNGKIWAATEQGVYISRDHGATWELRGLQGKDVRSIIAVDEDHVWAATWGFGVYELSAATGYEFVERNDGLTFTAVHALTADDEGNIYAGTFGGGIYKLAVGESTWEETSMPYDFVWALDASEGKIYAGTYGGGVYVSEDGGNTWNSENDGLSNNYIYSISIDPTGNVFASAWAAGVYKLSDDKNAVWSEMGMQGVRVTLISTGDDGSVYAATEDGKLYRYTENPTGVGEQENVTEFALQQNYPNPFNPTTQISFSIAKAGTYKLAVYNLLGEKVAELVNGSLNAGTYNVTFDASNLASGIYIYRLQGENVNFTRKMMLMK